MAGDALEDPFNPNQPAGDAPQPRPQALGVPKPGHRPTLTALLSTTDLDQATASDLDLPSAPPLSHAVLAGDDFDASDFLLARRHAPLDDLRSEVSLALPCIRCTLAMRSTNLSSEALGCA